MSGPTTSRPQTAPIGSDLRQVIIEFNRLVDDVEALRSALATHTHTENTAAAYTQNATTGAPTAGTITGVDTAGDLTAAKIADPAGTVVTS